MSHPTLDPHEQAGYDETEYEYRDTVMVPIEPEPFDWERDSGERPRPTGLMLNIAECRLVLVLIADDGSHEYRDLVRRLRGVIGIEG